MKVTTQETYRSFTQFRKSKKRFERIGFKCTDTKVTKTWGGIKIVALFIKEDGTVEDIARI